MQHDYTKKLGLVWQGVFLPEHAPAEWQDRATLWNAVEAAEKTKDSRLAREFVVALPTELSQEQNIALLSEFKPTDYAVANGAYVNSNNGGCWWWLRSPGTDRDRAAFVDVGGSVNSYGYNVYNVKYCVRPAMWISIE